MIYLIRLKLELIFFERFQTVFYFANDSFDPNNTVGVSFGVPVLQQRQLQCKTANTSFIDFTLV